MYQKILVAVDGSFNSELAAHHAIAIAVSCSSELVVLSVDSGEIDSEKLYYAVERIRIHAGKYGVRARSVVRKGEVVKIILAAIYSENADLLVIATRSSDYRLFVRSKAQQLMQKASCSVIAVKPAGIAMRGKSLLLPIEYKYAVDERIILTSALAKFYSFSVEILHVVELQRWYDLTWQELYRIRSRSEEDMMPFVEALREQGIDAYAHAVVSEKIISTILKETAIRRHSLVIMGASRSGILKQAVSGNPIEHMLSRSMCDVLVWRARR